MAELNELGVTRAVGVGAEGRAWRRLVVILLVITAVRLWLMSGQRVQAMQSGADDLLFLDDAEHLLRGEWLGPYSELRLVKGPGYPMFLAAAHGLHVPVMWAQHLFVVCVYWVLVFALRPLVRTTALLVGIFLVLVMSPVSMGPGSWLLFRDGIYPEQCVLVAACLVGLGARVEARRWVRVGWALAAGVAMGWVYISREEGIWIVPAGVILSLWGIMRAFRLREVIGRFDWVGFAVIPVGVMGAIVVAVCAMNAREYGMFGTVEFKESSFLAAMGAAQRREPEQYTRMVPVPHETELALYEVSPTFATLKPLMERDRHYFLDLSIENAPEMQGTGEVIGGMWMWEFRYAATAAGYHKDAKAARQFYQRMADEINAAFDAGKLHGGAKRDGAMGLSAPWRGEFARWMVDLTPGFLAELVFLQRETPEPLKFRSTVTDEMLVRYRAFLRGSDGGTMGNSDAAGAEFEAGYHGGAAYACLRAIQWCYRVLGLPLAAGGLAAAIWILISRRARGAMGWAAVAWLGVVASVMMRAILLLFIDVSSFPTIQTARYTAPAETYLLLANVLAIAGACQYFLNRKRAA